MDFWGGPFWDGTALVDILPFEHVSRNRGEDNKSQFLRIIIVLHACCGLLEEPRQPYKASGLSLVTVYPPELFIQRVDLRLPSKPSCERFQSHHKPRPLTQYPQDIHRKDNNYSVLS